MCLGLTLLVNGDLSKHRYATVRYRRESADKRGAGCSRRSRQHVAIHSPRHSADGASTTQTKTAAQPDADGRSPCLLVCRPQPPQPSNDLRAGEGPLRQTSSHTVSRPCIGMHGVMVRRACPLYATSATAIPRSFASFIVEIKTSSKNSQLDLSQ